MYEDDGWVERLRPEHAEREVAIAQLRAILLRGLTGRATIETDTQGNERRLDDIREGAF